MSGETPTAQGVRVAVEGCGHGHLDAIYASVTRSCQERGWDGVDVLIIGGDFQAVRNAADMNVMSVPLKYRKLGDFPAYYSGAKTAPYLTVFIAGNHEASSHLWELSYGGWVAPNIYYLGPANVLRLGPLRIAGMSGIWKGHDFGKTHYERLPFNHDMIKSFYHVREFDVRKLLQVRGQVDVGLSHDWPRAIERHGDESKLFNAKPFFKRESLDGTLGNPAATDVMDRLRPAYWFSAHMHVKFSAIKTYEAPGTEVSAASDSASTAKPVQQQRAEQGAPALEVAGQNPDEIDLDLDMDGDEDQAAPAEEPNEDAKPSESKTIDQLRAELPASFAPPPAPPARRQPGQPVPPTITNTVTRFLALDKCLPRHDYLQLCDISPVNDVIAPSDVPQRPYRLQYDPEWLAITRAFHKFLTIGDKDAQTPENLGEEQYRMLIDEERAWVDRNVVEAGKLDVPLNFAITAAPHVPGAPEQVKNQPMEYTSPQTQAFCDLLQIENLWDASEEERKERMAQGPPRSDFGGGRGGRGGRGRGGFRGGGGGGGGGFGRDRGRSRDRGRGG